MFVVSGKGLDRDLREAYRIMLNLELPADLRARLISLRGKDCLVLLTDDYTPLRKVGPRYIGLTRAHPTHFQIHVRPGLYRPVLILHELVHVVGGSELDAEAVELLACRKVGCKPVITRQEILEFRAKRKGRYMVWTF
jgi:hypothetical protein